MELSLLLMEQILSMAIMILMGFAIVRLGVVRSEDSGVLAAITLNVISPCVIINAFQITFSMEKLKGLLLAIGAAILLHVLFILCTHFIGKAAKLNSIERASLIYSNGGNLIIPLVSALLGEEAVFYSCAFIAVQNVLLWTHAVSLISAQKRRNLKKIVTNPNMIAIAVGLTLFLCRITLPELLGSTVAKVGGIVGPVCMLVIGMIMGGTNLKRVFWYPHAYLVCLGRLIVYPLLLILVLRITGMTQLFPEAHEILLVTLLAASAPVAVTVTNMESLFGSDPVRAGSINVMSVIFCIATMPLMVAIYQLVC